MISRSSPWDPLPRRQLPPLLNLRRRESVRRSSSCLTSIRIRRTICVAILSRFRHVISLEAQTISGGLAACVGMQIAKHGLPCRLHPLAVCESPDGTTGSPADRWRKYSLDRTSIVELRRWRHWESQPADEL